MVNTLPPFEGRDVSKASLRITKAGDGLSEALKMEPKAYHAGDEIYLVLKATVTQVNHKSAADSDDLVRVHTAEASEAAEVDSSDVEAFLSEQREKTRNLKDAAAGQLQLPDGVKAGKLAADE